MTKINLKNKKVAIAMSGGVDSGVAAALLVKAGYQCAGFHMHLWAEQQSSSENKCCSTESLEAARKTAHQLKMPFYTVDFSKIFKKQVVDYFLKAYGSGLTPNPCIFCNKFIKFGELLNYVRKLGFDYLATGHYARVTISSPDENFISVSDSLANKHLLLNKLIGARKMKLSKNLSGSLCHPLFTQKDYFHLLTGKDKVKDQSYFLYNLTQSQLAHVLFPVGEYQKREVVALAKKWQLPVASRPESQEICFLPENDYRPFLKRHIINKIKPGEIVDLKGNLIGEHQGLPLYTIGQRRGFEIRTKSIEQKTKGIIPPFYVIGKNIAKNQLIVGFNKETEIKEFIVKDLNWLNPNYQSLITDYQLLVRIRHQGKLLKCIVKRNKDVHVSLFEPERGVAPGQSAVFYFEHKRETRFPSKARDSYIPVTNRQSLVTDYEVLGGGIIGL